MIEWKDCSVSDLGEVDVSRVNLHAEIHHEHECSLLDWIVQSRYLASNLEEQVFALPFGTYYRFTVECFLPHLGKKVLGIGRSANRVSAASKACGEALERIVAFEAMVENISSVTQVDICDGNISTRKISECKHDVFPPKELRNSNGWAIHFDMNSAILSSVIECLERHILLFSYLKEGWDAFYRGECPSYEDVKLSSLVSKHGVGGFSAGICLSQTRDHHGVTLGYLSDSSDNIWQSAGWKKAFFESIEQALFFKGKPAESDPKSAEFCYGEIEKNQLYFLRREHDLDEGSPFEDLNNTPINDAFKKVSANLVVLDVSRKLGLGFPMYAAYTYGGDMIPLYFRSALDSLTAHEYLSSILRANGLSGPIAEYHPIL